MCAFGKMINSLIEKSQNCDDLGEFVCDVIGESGYDTYLNSLGDEGLSRADNVQELVNEMARYSDENEGATLSDYLEEVSLMSDVDNYDADAEAVVLMTIHSAKGLEFDNVFLAGMEDGLFPSLMSFNDGVELEEERRLAYVGVTRAKKRLYLTSCAYRMMYGRSQRNKISRFANEIPDSVKKIIDNCYSEPSYDDNVFGRSFGENSLYSSQSSFSGGYLGKRNEPMFEKSAVVTEKPKATSSSLDYKVGDVVHHRVFGDGLVISMTPMANDTLVEVSFEAGTKKIMANFAKLTKK